MSLQPNQELTSQALNFCAFHVFRKYNDGSFQINACDIFSDSFRRSKSNDPIRALVGAEQNKLQIFLVNTALGKGSHWIIGLMDLKNRKIKYVDSSSKDFHRFIHNVLKKIALASFGTDDLIPEYHHSPRQGNGTDCGIHVILLGRPLIQLTKIYCWKCCTLII